MLKRYARLGLVLLFTLTMTAPTWDAVEKVSLDHVFNQSTLLPFDMKGYAFVNGELLAYDDAATYKNYNVNGRVLTPIRLVADALTDSKNAVYWNIHWDASRPKVVTLTTSFEPKYKAVITVDSKTMEVNGNKVPLDVPAQLIRGRIVLPLRAIGEAVNREVAWLDRAIIISQAP